MGSECLVIHGQRISFELGPPWELKAPWDAPETQATHGVFLSAGGTSLQLHVRALPDLVDYPATPEGLRRFLFGQGWASKPFDVTTWQAHPLFGIAGTFLTRNPGEHVREWYLSDGARFADCCTEGPAADVAARLEDCERVVRSVRFLA